jgi:hypothetical protein
MGKFLRVNENAAFQPVPGGHDQLPPVFYHGMTGDQVIMPQGEAAEGGIDLALGHRLKLVFERKFHPFERYAAHHLFYPRHQRQGQLVKAASQETYPEDRALSPCLTLALLQRLPQGRSCGLSAEPEALTEWGQ